MNFIKRLSISISKLYPSSVKKRVKELLIYSGIKQKATHYLGASFLTSSLITALFLVFDFFFRSFNITTLLISLGTFFGTQGVFIVYPVVKAENRAKSVEKVLPDFFNLMAANIRSGMAPLSAMMAAAKEDFGVLSEEVEDAIAFSMGSESYEKILKIIVKKIDSVILDRIVKLLITGMRTGGRLSQLLEGASDEVIQMQTLRKELITSVRSYILFITIVIIAGLPFLLTVSTYFVSTVQNLQTMIGPSELVQAGPTSDISVEFLQIISYVVMTATSFFASLLIGSVVDESFIQGLKYFLPLLALSIIIYVFASNIIPMFVGTPF